MNISQKLLMKRIKNSFAQKIINYVVQQIFTIDKKELTYQKVAE